MDESDTVAAAPFATPLDQTWAFAVSGYLGGTQHFNGYLVTIQNARTNTTMKAVCVVITSPLQPPISTTGNVVEVGDTLELTVTDAHGNIASERFNFTVNSMNLAHAVLNVRVEGIGAPETESSVAELPEPFQS